jgi:hypothetical protein
MENTSRNRALFLHQEREQQRLSESRLKRKYFLLGILLAFLVCNGQEGPAFRKAGATSKGVGVGARTRKPINYRSSLDGTWMGKGEQGEKGGRLPIN